MVCWWLLVQCGLLRVSLLHHLGAPLLIQGLPGSSSKNTHKARGSMAFQNYKEQSEGPHGLGDLNVARQNNFEYLFFLIQNSIKTQKSVFCRNGISDKLYLLCETRLQYMLIGTGHTIWSQNLLPSLICNNMREQFRFHVVKGGKIDHILQVAIWISCCRMREN